MKKLFTLFSLLSCCFEIFGQAGQPDPSFGSNGVVRVDLSATTASKFTKFDHAGIQADGKVIAGGLTLDTNYVDPTVFVRFTSDATIDSISHIYMHVPGTTANEVIQPDGKIVSINGFGFWRFNPDGTVDIRSQSVTLGDQANGDVLAVIANGKVVVAGEIYQTNYIRGYPVDQKAWAIARFNSDGHLDSLFGNSGTTTGTFFDLNSGQVPTAVGIQSDGSVIISLNNITPNDDPNIGPPELIDVSLLRFDSVGKISTLLSYYKYQQDGGPIWIQNDDKILFKLGLGLFRFNADGNYDSTFPQLAPYSIAMQNDGKLIASTPSSMSRYDQNGVPDSSFGTNGTIPAINYIINEIRITNNKLVAAGYDQNGQSTNGVVGVYLLDGSSSISCSSAQTVSNDKEKCSAVVASIDPVLTDSTLAVNYTLTGATNLNGIGSASGITFNLGVTTITYALTNDPSATCSFDVTVNDSGAPRMTNIVVVPEVLWPVTQKMQRVFLDYQTRDNCGIPSCQVSVTGNQDVTGDWAMVNDHVVNLRATQGQGLERIYSIAVTCTDAAGNTTSKNTKVSVPGQHLYPNIDGGGALSFEFAGELSANAYPNPSNDYFRLHIVSPDRTNPIDIKVYDITGRLMEEKYGISAGQDTRIGAALGAGVYLVQMQQGKNWAYTKLVKTARK